MIRSLRVAFLLFFLGVAALPLHAEEWRPLAPGLELREFLTPDRVGDLAGEQGVLAVLRIDPACYAFSLGSALDKGVMLTVGEWSRRFGFTAVINAGMFRAADRLRGTGYMRDGHVAVNTFVHPGYGAFLAFQPREASLPDGRVLDFGSGWRLFSWVSVSWQNSSTFQPLKSICLHVGGRLPF